MLELHRTTSSFVTNGTQYRRCQLPILNAFALTVHKVQGLSLASVTTTLTKTMFADGQGYVALSRATTPEQLFISQLDFDAIRADPDAIAEYQRLEAKAANFAAAASA
jgi:ATP-dependent exoDNAse (exonuclease V) alpha subunit